MPLGAMGFLWTLRQLKVEPENPLGDYPGGEEIIWPIAVKITCVHAKTELSRRNTLQFHRLKPLGVLRKDTPIAP
jgi:hypothetical protein